MSKGSMSGILKEIEAVMELRKEEKQKIYGPDLVGAARDGRTFAQFRFILSNGGIFEFVDYL